MTNIVAREPLGFRKPEGLLAHFTSAEVAFEHVLPTGKIRMSPYRLMRDPAENKDLMLGTGFFGDPPNSEASLAKATQAIKFIRDSVRLLSFTLEGPGEGGVYACCWARPRMWEQYGDTHRGVCLLFDRERLEANLTSQFKRQPGPFYFGEVQYSASGIAGSATDTIIDDRLFDEQKRDIAVMEYVDRNHSDFFLLKSDDFASEREFRALIMHPDPASELRPPGDDFVYPAFGDALVAVVLGERFPRWQFPGVETLLRSTAVELRRLHWERGRPWALSVPFAA